MQVQATKPVELVAFFAKKAYNDENTRMPGGAKEK